MGKMVTKLCAIGIICLAAACAPIDRSPILRDGTAPTDFDTVSGQANALATRYLNSAGDSANAAQVFEIPVIGAAITAVAALAFGAHPDVALVAGVVGASSGALGIYYKPRETAIVYTDGAVATLCIRGLAIQAKKSFVKINKDLSLATYLASLGLSQDNTISKLTNSLDTVAVTIFRRLLSETRPNMDEILAKIKSDLEKGENNEESLNVAFGAGFFRAGTPNPADDPDVKFILNFDEKITSCTVKAGTV